MLHHQLHGVSLSLGAATVPVDSRPGAEVVADAEHAASAHVVEQALAHAATWAEAAERATAAYVGGRHEIAAKAGISGTGDRGFVGDKSLSPRVAAAAAMRATTFAAAQASYHAESLPLPLHGAGAATPRIAALNAAAAEKTAAVVAATAAEQQRRLLAALMPAAPPAGADSRAYFSPAALRAAADAREEALSVRLRVHDRPSDGLHGLELTPPAAAARPHHCTPKGRKKRSEVAQLAENAATYWADAAETAAAAHEFRAAGYLHVETRRARIAALFQKHDANGDGVFSQSEFEEMLREMMPHMPTPQVLRLYRSMRQESHGVVDMDAFERMLIGIVGGGGRGGGGGGDGGGGGGRHVDSPTGESSTKPTTRRTGPSRWRQQAVRLGLKEVVELPAAADVIKAAKAEAETEAARAAPPPRRQDGSSTSSSLKGSPRRQRTLVGQRTTYADSAESGAPISAEAEARRPSSAFRRISIRSPSGTTRGSLVALNRPVDNQASWYRLGTPTAYPSEEPPPMPAAALTPRAAALATALESLLLPSRPGSADESPRARRAAQHQSSRRVTG